MKIAVILPYFTKFNKLKDYDYIIGVDKGALNALSNNIKLDFAIGDFDSISSSELELIKSNVRVHVLSKYKDETDTLEALRYANTLSSNVTIFGGLVGKRIDHLLANINLFNNYPNLLIEDDNTKCYLKEESFLVELNEYKYISFFSFTEKVIISLKGFKYNLDNYPLNLYDSLCISNEKTSNPFVEITSGKLLVIESLDDN